jgi:hypothetical protein
MSRRLLTVAAAAAASVVTAALCASPASAVIRPNEPQPDYNLVCNATGVRGTAQIWDWYSGATSVPINFIVTDTAADGHHVEIRVVGRTDGGGLITWPWHSVTTGNGTVGIYSSTANYSAGMYDLGIEAGTFEGSDMLHSCFDWIRAGTT